MNRDCLKGIVMGVAASALVLGMGVTAFAANRSITVSDGIRVLVNGQAFQPKDGNGAPVELFSYNGTVYAPVRAICEEAGMAVSYDADTRTVSVTKPASGTQAPAAPSQTSTGTLIGEAKAKQAALDHAGVRSPDAVFTEFKQKQGYGTTYYEMEFYSGPTEYEYEVDAVTGQIRKSGREYKAGTTTTPGVSSQITEARAREIALGRAPGATVTKCKLDHDDGRAIYELDLRSGSTKYECEIDASTGTILKWELDD